LPFDPLPAFGEELSAATLNLIGGTSPATTTAATLERFASSGKGKTNNLHFPKGKKSHLRPPPPPPLAACWQKG
jgi:hypothetical protein